MEYFGEENRIHLSGKVLTEPVFNHKTYGEAFYLLMLGVLRKSGCEDRIRLLVSERILGGRSPREGELVDLYGQIRTYNREDDGEKSSGDQCVRAGAGILGRRQRRLAGVRPFFLQQ